MKLLPDQLLYDYIRMASRSSAACLIEASLRSQSLIDHLLNKFSWNSKIQLDSARIAAACMKKRIFLGINGLLSTADQLVLRFE